MGLQQSALPQFPDESSGEQDGALVGDNDGDVEGLELVGVDVGIEEEGCTVGDVVGA